MRAARQLHPRLLARAANVSFAEMLTAFVMGLGIAMFLLVALFALAIGFGWHFYKRYWEKLTREIEEAAKKKADQDKREADANAAKAGVTQAAEEDKSQPAVDTANEIIRE